MPEALLHRVFSLQAFFVSLLQRLCYNTNIMEQDELLKNHLTDLARQAETRSMYTYSGFLGLAEQDIYEKVSRELGFIDHSLYGGSEAAERVIAVFGSEKQFGYAPDYPIRVVCVRPVNEKFAEELSHRDYLGAVLNLGIERTLIGDIVIRGKNAWIYCLNTIVDFLKENLTTVKHTDVVCEEASFDVPELKPVLEETRVNVASERLDAIVAAFTKISRSKAVELFTRQRVYVNGKCIEKPSAGLKPGDVLSVRGFGKAVYGGIDGKSKKGRLYVILNRYV